MAGTPVETGPRRCWASPDIEDRLYGPWNSTRVLTVMTSPSELSSPRSARALQPTVCFRAGPEGLTRALPCPSSSRHPETNLAAGTRCGSWDLLTGIALVHRAVRQVEVVYGEFHNSLRNPFRLRHVPSVGQRSEPGTCGLWQLDTGPYQSGHNRGSGGPRLRKRRCQEDSSLACIRSHRPSSDRSGTRR